MQGNMPALLSHYRPDLPIFMFTDDEAVQRRMAMYHGVTPLQIQFGNDAEETFNRRATLPYNPATDPAVLHGGLLMICTVSPHSPIAGIRSADHAGISQQHLHHVKTCQACSAGAEAAIQPRTLHVLQGC